MACERDCPTGNGDIQQLACFFRAKRYRLFDQHRHVDAHVVIRELLVRMRGGCDDYRVHIFHQINISARVPELDSGAMQHVVRGAAIREHAGVAPGQCDLAASGQSRIVDDDGRLLARGKRERVGEHHAPFGVGVDDLDRRSVQRGDEILRLVRVRAEAILRDREPRIDAERNAQLGECEQCAERDGAALHVGVHVEHAQERLQVRAAGVEDDALADEGQRRRRDARGPIAQL